MYPFIQNTGGVREEMRRCCEWVEKKDFQGGKFKEDDEISVQACERCCPSGFFSEEQLEEIEKLDLTGLTELKRSSNGSVEIKCTDRIKVLEALLCCVEEGESSAAAFLKVLDKPEERESPEVSRR